MAERDPVTPDSITTLIYVDMRGETGGYRTDLLKEQVPESMKKFIICSKCDGISKGPKITDSKTFCTNCTGGRGGEVDGRVEEFVRELKCRCPLSTRGCDWSGKLDNIEEHMNGCVKVKIKCKKGCGEVLQKCDTIDHEKECPFRIQECEYCKEEVRANQANEHIRLCQHHPDGVVTCPYMEVGCDTIEIARKNLETHITQNVVSHQKLLLRELNQLRTENKQLRADNEQLRVTNERHEQSIQCLMSTAGYITEHIADRGKTLQGIELTYKDLKGEKVYGPIFYLGQCKLRIHVITGQGILYRSSVYDADYYVTRLKGDNDDVIDSCTITYIHLYNVDLADNRKFNINSIKEDRQLKVGDEYSINRKFGLFNKINKLTTIRIFFDML